MAEFVQRSEDDLIHGMAVQLVTIIHLSMDWDIWGKKRLKYWEILQDNIAAAAYTDKLSRWLSNICHQMQVPKAGRNEADRQILYGILNSGHDKKILAHLREETHYIIVEVQVLRQEAKDKEPKNEKTKVTMNQMALTMEEENS